MTRRGGCHTPRREIESSLVAGAATAATVATAAVLLLFTVDALKGTTMAQAIGRECHDVDFTLHNKFLMSMRLLTAVQSTTCWRQRRQQRQEPR